MRLIIFGHNGMLGRYVEHEARTHGHVIITPEIDIADKVMMEEFAYNMSPDAIINCAGAISTKHDMEEMLRANALGPHVIAKHFTCPIIHVSTDCVFSGERSHNYFIEDTPDAKEIYGRTKALGEVRAPNVINVRTSFIGPDHGFFKWLLDSEGHEVEGWANHIWSGSTVQEVARHLIKIAEKPTASGIQHLATLGNISKLALIVHIVKTLDLNITVRPESTKFCWRGLRPTITMNPVTELIDDLNSIASWSRATPSKVSG